MLLHVLNQVRLISAALKVGSYTVISRATGFLRDILMAQHIGTSIVMDALVIAIKIPSFLRRIFAEGALNASFIPIYAELNSKNKEAGFKFANDVMCFLLVILSIIIIVAEIFMPAILPAICPGFKSEALKLAIFFSQITFPFILFISLTALLSGVLNACEKFDMAASSQIAGNIFIILIIYCTNVNTINNGNAVALAISGSGFVQLLWVYIPLKLLGFKISFKKPQLSSSMKKFFKRLLPAATGSGVLQINLFLDTIIASRLPRGTISYLYYADRLYHLPISITGTALGTVLLPLLAKQWKQADHSGAMHNQNRAIEFAMLITLPAMLGLIYLAHPLVSIIFERGKFDAYAALATAKTLTGFATGLPAYILIKIFNSSFFAKEDTKTPIIVAVASMILNICLNLILVGKFKHLGIALATSLASWCNAIILLIILNKKNYFKIDQALINFLKSLSAPLICTFLILFGLQKLSKINVLETIVKDHRLAFMLINVSAAITIYLLITKRLGLLNFKEYITPVSKKIFIKNKAA